MRTYFDVHILYLHTHEWLAGWSLLKRNGELEENTLQLYGKVYVYNVLSLPFYFFTLLMEKKKKKKNSLSSIPFSCYIFLSFFLTTAPSFLSRGLYTSYYVVGSLLFG